ncbi:META domain-containing protein [Algoriphagus zhangzhouensis]|uniref:META domain-containing protein n=1 Tax=Algoriphagus zhangzhouensis TaxID=1073327 RepID=A0A1M7Z8U2_9BACT|nr:META domain-containing protein [Algoriphagus zhangzhouensis]TDY47515.1 META domain-containing protein [Algoriphagus zhangzhouensis]SHO61363.1 META domain-containing protein [Algoriphagus zhangzhouensis]
MKYLKILSPLFFLIIFNSCGSVSNINPFALLSKNPWALSSLMGSGLDLNKFTGGLPSLSFLDGGKLAGYSGCNDFSGSFQLEGTGIQLDPGAITKKACPGNGEQTFLDAIAKVRDFKVSKDKLTLLQGAEEIMTLVPKKD